MHKPPLKWAGGKRWLVSHLKPIWEANTQRRYVEPFCGGLAVALGLQPGACARAPLASCRSRQVVQVGEWWAVLAPRQGSLQAREPQRLDRRRSAGSEALGESVHTQNMRPVCRVLECCVASPRNRGRQKFA